MEINEMLKNLKEKEERIHEENFLRHGQNKSKCVDFVNHWILSASLGSFGLSVAFVSNLKESLVYLNFIFASWIIFVIDIMIIFYMYYRTVKIDDKAQMKINELRKTHESFSSELYNILDNEPCKKINWRKLMNILSKVVLISFSVALISALIFAMLNFKNMNNKKNVLNSTVINNNYYNNK